MLLSASSTMCVTKFIVPSGCIFSQAGNELGTSLFLANNKFLNNYTLYLMHSCERARSQTD
jgi:hypothetical protein